MRRTIFTFGLIIFILLLGGGYLLQDYLEFRRHAEEALAQTLNTVTSLENRIASIDKVLSTTSSQTAAANKSISELKSQTRSQNQEELLTDAVAKVTPSVVSIVISKDIPRLEVVYINPFGNSQTPDPRFFIPVYRQRGTEKKQIGAGTGFVVREDGYIATNKHVVEDAKADYTVLLSDGTQKQGRVVYRDDTNDIAILKIDAKNLRKVDLGNSDNLKLGTTVIAIGNALGEYSNSVSTGIVSGLKRSLTAQSVTGETETFSNVIQTDAAINRGNSGGPLINISGEVVGINVATIAGSSNISFAIPINTIKEAIASVIGN